MTIPLLGHLNTFAEMRGKFNLAAVSDQWLDMALLAARRAVKAEIGMEYYTGLERVEAVKEAEANYAMFSLLALHPAPQRVYADYRAKRVELQDKAQMLIRPYRAQKAEAA